MKLISTFIALLFLGSLSAQVTSTKSKRAEKYFSEAQNYFQLRENYRAIDQLERALEEDECFSEAMLLMADIYNDLGNDSLQVVYLENASKLGSGHIVKIAYVLGNAYYRLGNYVKAKENYNSFISNSTEGHALYQKAKDKLVSCDFALSLMKDAIDFDATNLGENINSDFDEYWPSLTVDGKTIIYTRLVPTTGGSQTAGRFQEDFFMSNLDENEWQLAEPMKSINTPYNEGAQSISADGKLLFFTACTQSDGYGSCDIYFSRNKAGVWTEPKNAGTPVNTSAWESQPSISANGEYLYFVSNRPGGNGGMDIWRCHLNGFFVSGDPRWGNPQNLGGIINTSGNEMSPFIHADGKTLYFASDKLMGLGGYDIFYSRLTNDTVWETPANMGYPINTHKDEQGLIVEASGVRAYYSSDRPGSKGLDIYQFDLHEKARPTPVSYVRGKVFDKSSGLPLCAQIELIDLDKNKLIAKTESCWEKGEFLVCLPLGNEYAFNVSRSGYLFHSENFALKQVRKADNPFQLDIPLNTIEVGNATVLRNIFFETGKHSLLSHSKAELGKLMDFMEKNPQVKIEIGGHTDDVGSKEFNLELSQNRAQSVYNYLVENGVGASRLSYQGYGFSVPFADNETAEGRALNRRTEFKIISTNL
jgi:outer membrane protein OmpA-like peptidoglycan-associated protein/tetratricopeptide (TPR) repeat protein